MVDFTKREDVERWLEGKSRDAALVIGARGALRTIPALSATLSSRREPKREMARRDILWRFRATSACWVAARYPTCAAEIMAAIRPTISNRFGSATVVARSAVDGSPIFRDPVDAVTIAVRSAIDASTAIHATAADVAAAIARAVVTAVAITPSIRPAVLADARAIENGVATTALAGFPLWIDGGSEWESENWARLNRALLAANEDWEVWTDWYEARRDGSSTNEALEIARVLIDKDFWWAQKVANAKIKRLVEEHAQESSNPNEANVVDPMDVFAQSLTKPFQQQRANLPTAEFAQDREPPTIPAPRPAAIEPIWLKGRLTVPKKPARADLNKKKFEAALLALRAELRELVDDVSAEANIDKRPAAFLRLLVERIPETMPQQDELFRLGHVEAIFAGYAKTVDQEWPDFIASRYHAVSLQFDRTMRQAPLWREFKRNAAKETLSIAQVADSTSLAREAASALQQGEAASFVDPAISQSLEQLADALPVAKAGEELPPDAIEAGEELLAADLVESVNNTLKPIAEVALSAARDYAEGVGKGFKKAAKKQGPIDGEKAFKWLRRLAVGGGVGAGSFVALSNLIAKFPEAFGWLERLLHFIR